MCVEVGGGGGGGAGTKNIPNFICTQHAFIND